MGMGLTEDILHEVCEELISGLVYDGAHHKQYYLEQALLLLRGDDGFSALKTEHKWEDGIPA